jgi:hypothetical protein
VDVRVGDDVIREGGVGKTFRPDAWKPWVAQLDVGGGRIRAMEIVSQRERNEITDEQTICKRRQTAMKTNKSIYLCAAVAVFSLTAALSAIAQQITGVPGSPSTTVTIDGKQIPPPPMPFGGVIKESALDSKPYWPPRVVPPKGAPNVLLIMTDDQGYGVSSTFGGVIPTPALDRVAKAGLRYTQFHSTALCSPTRAALITGRNHHSVGSGVIGELSTGYPGYDSIIAEVTQPSSTVPALGVHRIVPCN